MAFAAVDFHTAFVGIANGLHDREPKASAAEFACARLVDTEESLEEMRQRSLRNPDAVVGYFEHGSPVTCLSSDLDSATCGGVFDGIVQKIHDNLF